MIVYSPPNIPIDYFAIRFKFCVQRMSFLLTTYVFNGGILEYATVSAELLTFSK